MVKELLRIIKRKVQGLFDEHERIVNAWRHEDGEKRRYAYDLDKNSIVFDVGGYLGQWSESIQAKYQCSIFIFEPVKSFYEKCRDKFKDNNQVKVYNVGLSNENKHADIPVAQDASSLYKKSDTVEKIELRKASDFIMENGIKNIDLMKINIEGEEYNLLDDLIAHDMIKNIDNLQIQFHNFFPDAKIRMKKIQEEMKKTHHLTFQYEFVWENWQRNK